MSQTISDVDFEIDEETIRYPEPHDSPSKLTWRAFEAWVRQQHDIEQTAGVEEDGWCPEKEQGIEIKSALWRQSGGDLGRIILRRHQHRAALEEERDYVVGVLEMNGEQEWTVLDAVRIPAVEIDEWCNIPQRSWVPRDGYYEMGIRWKDIPYIRQATYRRDYNK